MYALKSLHLISDFMTFPGCDADIHVTVKIESADSIPNLHSIIAASDGVSHYLLILLISLPLLQES